MNLYVNLGQFWPKNCYFQNGFTKTNFWDILMKLILLIYKLSSSIRSLGTFTNFTKMVELFRFLTFVGEFGSILA